MYLCTYCKYLLLRTGIEQCTYGYDYGYNYGFTGCNLIKLLVINDSVGC